METINLVQDTSVTIDILIDRLINLQNTRIDLDDLNKEIKLLKEEHDKEEKKYSSKKFHFQKNLPYLEKVSNDFKKIEDEIAVIHQRILNCEERKKKIKTVKEFKALNTEIEHLNQTQAIKENALIDKAEDLEFKKTRMDKIEESLKETEAELNLKKEELGQIFEERKNEIKKVTTEKEKCEKELSTTMVNVFNRIYENKKQLAIVQMINNVCQGCYSLLPLQIEVNLNKKDELIFCPSCSRIIHTSDEEVVHDDEQTE